MFVSSVDSFFAAPHRIILEEVPYPLVPYKHTGGV